MNRDRDGVPITDGSAPSELRIAIVVPFLNEEEHLPLLLESIDAQTQPPQQLVLVDDGSTDRSYEIGATFSRSRGWAKTIRRPPRPPRIDRLAHGSVVHAFYAGLRTLQAPWDILGKLDADLRLHPELLACVRERFASDEDLGVTGTFLSVRRGNGTLEREHRPVHHVLGPNKFYRRQCFEQIDPIPPILGWDTIDDLRARTHGWRTESFALPKGETLHLRPMGAHDGRLRAFRRWGRCAWGYGASPTWVALGGIYRMRLRPRVVGGINYVLGYLLAACTHAPRAEAAVRERARHEEKARLRHMLASRGAGRSS